LDLKATLDNNVICNIEIQLTDKHNTEKRILDYWAKLYGSQLKAKEEYKELKPVISIFIADYEMKRFINCEPCTEWKVIETKNRQEVLTDDLELHIIILPRALKELENNELRKWLMFLDNPNELEVRNMAKEDKEIEKAMERLETVSGDEHTRWLAELREKAIHDEASALGGAREEGKLEEKRKIARNLLDNEIDIEIIEKTTGLTKEEIKKLKN